MDSGDGSSNSSSSGGSSLSMSTADHGPQLAQRHTRVVSLSWPGETRHGGEEPLPSRAIEHREALRTEEEREETAPVAVSAPAHAAAAAAAPAAPSKRQRQMDWANTKTSSGPIDIPPSPGDQQQHRGGQPSTFHQDSLLGYHATVTTREEGASSGRGGRAATDAGAWYPCWPRTRPDEDSSGDGGGPPAHILIWERSFMRSASLQQRALATEEPLEAGLGSRRVSEGSARGEVQGQEEEEEDEEDEDADGYPERRMSDQSMFEMDF